MAVRPDPSATCQNPRKQDAFWSSHSQVLARAEFLDFSILVMKDRAKESQVKKKKKKRCSSNSTTGESVKLEDLRECAAGVEIQTAINYD